MLFTLKLETLFLMLFCHGYVLLLKPSPRDVLHKLIVSVIIISVRVCLCVCM